MTSYPWRLMRHAMDLDDEGHDSLGSSWKAPVVAASTANVTLATGVDDGETLDGITLATGDRILLKDQTADEENGVYVVVASGAPTRAVDLDSGADVLAAVVPVIGGTSNEGTFWRVENATPPVIDTDPITFAQFDAPGGGGGAPTTVDYLVGTADAGLSGEIVVGTTPGGELGGTWASPTVDTTHSGSSHAGVVTAHEAAGDPHTGYRLESADHSHATTGLQGGTVDHGVLTGLSDDDHPQYATNTEFDDHSARHETGGADAIKLDDLAAPDDNTDRNVSTSAHGLTPKITGSDGDVLTKSGTAAVWSTPSGGGAPTGADYLVGTAQGGLSAEIVVGTTPGGELGGTWASPTVDSTHSGSSHAGVVTAHEAAGDPHTGYRLESADHTHASAGLQGGQVAHSALSGIAATDHHVAPAAGPDANVTVDAAGAAGTASTFARSGHGHQVVSDIGVASTQAFGDSATAGTSGTVQRGSHKHAMPANPVTAHEAAGDPHTGYVREADANWVDLTDGGASTLHSHAGGGGGAPTTVDYLVGTADAGLSAEIVVGTSPGGELGGTWASPTVDALHSGSTHTDFIAKAIVDAKGDIIAATAADTVSRLAVGADDTILMADAAAGTGLKWVASQTPSTQAYSDAAAQGTADTYARGDHKHAMPANLPAGSATALSWPVLGSGTLLTTPEAGAFERDANNIYMTTDAGNRGYVPIRHYIRRSSAMLLPNNTSLNKLFDSPTNGRLTLEAGLYKFEGLLTMSGMSATSGNMLVSLIGAGTSTLSALAWSAIGAEVAPGGNTTTTSTAIYVAAASAASVVVASTNTGLQVILRGTFVATAGTIIPSAQLVTAVATAAVGVGSYMMFERIGVSATVSLGQWD